METYEKQMLLIKREKDRQEELATLNKGFQVANVFVNKGYLDEFSNAPIITENKMRIMDTQKLRLIRVSKVVFDPKEDVMDKMTSFYGSLYNLSATAAVFIRGFKSSVEFYFATRSDFAAPLAGEIMTSTLTGNFPGIDIESFTVDETSKLLDSLGRDTENREMIRGLTTVSMIPAIRDKEKKDQFVQGMEKLINTLKGKEYLAVLLAEPMNSETITIRRHGLEEMYSTMTPHAKLTYAYGENVSHTVGKGISSSFSQSVNESVSNSNSSSSSRSESQSQGRSSGSSFGGGSSQDGSSANWGYNSGTNSSTSQSYTSGTSFSHSISKSMGTSDTEGTSENESDTTGTSTTKTLNYENKGISELLQRIEQQLVRLNQQESYGMWEAAAYFFSNEVSTAVLAAATYKAIMAGENSGIEQAHVNVWTSSQLQEKNIRNIYDNVRYLVHPRAEIVMTDEYKRQYVTPTTLVSSTELGLLMGFPRKSVAGLAVQEMAEFGRAVVYENKKPKKSITFGKIYHMGIVEDTPVQMDLDLFSSHCFITGSSGSGKSYATYNLLDRLLTNGVHMLVVEPAKGEYKQIFGNLAHVNIYTTESTTYQLLRINPFQFPDKIHILSHIEQVMQIFSASWPLYAAMPAILKQSVVNAYVLCGWDIQNSVWVPGISDHKYPVFADVLKTLPDIINTSDYSADSKGDYKGALLTRVEAMTTGMNGLIFKKSEGISDEKLFDENTLIDLSEVGSGETIALLMGVLIMRLNEYRKSQRKLGMVSSHDSGLKHVTVLEEAHNLLKRTNKEQGEDGGNMIGKSVEMISNSIKEMRTYGEGFLIIDQSPLAVDSSAIENTATKIIMNTPSKDACNELGSALSLNEEQTKELSKLNVGVAAVLQKGWMSPVLMKIDLWDAKKYEAPLQFEDQSMTKYVRSCLLQELLRQAREKSYRSKPFGDIIRRSALKPDRKTELNEVVNAFNTLKAKSREFTPQMTGSLVFEIISCRAMIDVIPTDKILTPVELDRITDEKNQDEITEAQVKYGIQWLTKAFQALDLYVNVSDEEKTEAVKYMLAALGEDGNAVNSKYGLLAFMMNLDLLTVNL